jgi:hypothetical protein
VPRAAAREIVFLLAAEAESRYKQQCTMSQTLIYALAALVAFAAIGVFLFLWNRPPAEEEYFHFNCPGCKRRLRYKPQQAGRKGACPRCKESFMFPLAHK